MRAIILSAGRLDGGARVRALTGKPDLVICADGGFHHAAVLGLEPDMVVGDFDSAKPGTAAELDGKGVRVHRVPREKDWTDTDLAVRIALEKGATDLLLLGCTGTRLDHTLSNLQLLASLPSGVTAAVADAHNLIRVVGAGGRITVEGERGDYLSLVPLSPVVSGISIDGVRWPLEGAELRWGMSLGISNELTDRSAVVSVQEGWLYVIQAWD